MDLAELQHAMRAYIEGRLDAPVGLQGAVDGQRAVVYRTGVTERHVGPVVGRYPTVCALLGEQPFDVLVRGYVASCPPTTHHLGSVADGFVDFIRHMVGPALGDIAALDHARARSLLAPEAQVRDLSDGLPCRLAFVPSLRVLTCAHKVLSTLAAVRRGETASPPEPGTQTIAVWRDGHRVREIALQPVQAALLARAMGGGSLSELRASKGADPILEGWLRAGWLLSVL